MKYAVIKIPSNGSNISKSAHLFDNAEDAVLHQAASPYDTVLATLEGDEPSWFGRVWNWINGSKDSTV